MTDEQLKELAARFAAARANGDPAKYVTWVTVEDAHAAASAIRQLMSERDEARRMYEAALEEAMTIAAIFRR